MRLANPLFLLLVIPVSVIIFFYLKGRIGKEAGILFSSLDLVRRAGTQKFSTRRLVSGLLKGLVFVLIIVALTRPQTGHGEQEEKKYVVDIMLALDVSSSMATLDFHPDNRLTAAKLEAKRFIENRPHDRIGLLVFAKHGITQCPLTMDRRAVLDLLKRIRMGTLQDGTAIGVGIAGAVNRLKDSEAKSKIVILLTDGVNNSGEIDPLTAAKIAKKFGIRVYTIGMGIDGEALLPVPHPRFGTRLVRVKTEIDEEALENISRITGGLYFRAKDEKGLRNIFSQIDRLEKTEITIEKFTRYDDHFRFFLWMALTVLLFELALTNVVFFKIP